MKNMKSKILLIFIVLFAVLSTAYIVNAKTEKVKGQLIMESYGAGGPGGYITFEDLAQRADILCSQPGGPLPGEGGLDEIGKLYPHIKPSDLGLTTKKPLSSIIRSHTLAYYKRTGGGKEIATPKEAYILSEMKFGGGVEKDYIQLAWWTTPASGHSSGSDGVKELLEAAGDMTRSELEALLDDILQGNALAKEATAFEGYILKAAGVDSTSKLKHKNVEIELVDGTTRTFEGAFDFEYKPEWVTGGEYDNPEVKIDADGTFLVGPFAIDYLELRYQAKGRPEVEFAGIKGMEVYVDSQEAPLTIGDGTNHNDWEFVWVGGESGRASDDKYAYPHSKEKFYIRLYDIKDATKIINIKTQFRYMNACGEYYVYEGEYYETEWKRKYDERTYTDSEGNPHTVRTNFRMELTGVKGVKAQKLSIGAHGARWYEFCELDREINIKDKGSISITKNVVDEHGKIINDLIDPNKTFTFTLVVEGALEGERIEKDIEVKPGQTVNSEVYTWYKKDTPPTYTLTEKDTDGYEIVSLGGVPGATTVSGSFEGNGKTIPIEAINKKEKNIGDLEIIKKIQDYDIPEVKESADGANSGQGFKFKVTIKGESFYYEGQEYGNAEPLKPLVKEVYVKAESSVILKDIEWYTKLAPTYEVEEILDVPGFEQVGDILGAQGALIARKNGSLIHVVAVATNKLKEEEGSLQIIKKVDLADLIDSLNLPEGVNIDELLDSNVINIDKILKQEFEFDVKVTKKIDGSVLDSKTVILTDGVRTGTVVTFHKTVGTYRWYYGYNPNYTITENVPEGYEFKHFIDADGNESGNPVTGTLKPNENGEIRTVITAENKLKLAPKNAEIVITKKIGEENRHLLEDKDYTFIVTLTGPFRYNGVGYTSGKYQISNVAEDGTLMTTGARIVKMENDEIDTSVVVRIHVNSGAAEASWKMEGISWYQEYEPTPEFTAEENIPGSDIDFTIAPSSGDLLNSAIYDEANNKYIVNIIAMNMSEARLSKLKIIKEVEDSEHFTTEFLESLEFKFIVNVEKFGETVITLNKNNLTRKDGKIIWEGETQDYNWSIKDYPTGTAPEYTIKEDTSTNGAMFASATYETYENGKIVTKTTTENLVEGTLIPNELANIEFEVNDVTYINKFNIKHGNLEITKEVTHKSLEGKDFTFNVTLKGLFKYKDESGNEEWLEEKKLEGIVVKGGETKIVFPNDIEWYGNSSPSYLVEEIESDFSEKISESNTSGNLVENTTVTASFVNGPKYTNGTLIINKQIEENKVAYRDDVFTFEIKITKDGEEPQTIYASLKANETYELYQEWVVTENAPEFYVREMDLTEGVSLSDIQVRGNTKDVKIDISKKTVEGSFEPKTEISVVYINKYEEHHGSFMLTKRIIADEKVLAKVEKKFTFDIRVKGTFFIVKKDGEVIPVVNGVYEIKDLLIEVPQNKDTESYHSSKDFDIVWYGDKAPTVEVDETGKSKGWQYVSTAYNGRSLKPNKEVEIIVTNELPMNRELVFTIELAGNVWEDIILDGNDKNVPYTSVPNGVLDEEKEEGIEGVEVYIYDDLGNPATIYSDIMETPLSQPIITNTNGFWDAPLIKITKNAEGKYNRKYYAVFVYDGQTYEPTTFLARKSDYYDESGAERSLEDVERNLNRSVEEKVEEYKALNIAENLRMKKRDEFRLSSMALDVDRDSFNKKFAEILGDSAISDSGTTTGKAKDGEKENALYYDSYDYTDGGKVSILRTKNPETGNTYTVFKNNASTAVADIKYPFDDRATLSGMDAVLTDKGYNEIYYFNATYDYCLHVNLGLKKRKDSDISVLKDLVSANVVIRDEVQDYRFNKLADLITRERDGAYNRSLASIASEVEYKLGLYSTDYYYRAEMYEGDSALYDDLVDLYKDINGIDSTEMEIYLTYAITIFNDSPTDAYKVKINELNDYFDSTFGTPIGEEIKKGDKVLATKSTYSASTGATGNVDWSGVIESDIKGSDGVTYNKVNTNSLSTLELASGEKVDIYVSFKISKEQFNGAYKSISLGNKANIAEISNYTVLDSKTGNIAGKIDKDSAPDNINLRSHNEAAWYEDDTCNAPVLKLGIEDISREINGTAWEDSGNGIYDANEALIGGLTTELIEKISANGKEYDYLWPTNKHIDALGGKTFEELTGFSSITETSKDAGKVGTYNFTGIPEGKYVVRFLYGNDKFDLADSYGLKDDAIALKSDGTKYSDETLTANYSGDGIAVYNGQDYKSAIYQKGITENIDSATGYLINRAHNLNNENLAVNRISDARDSEVRRLQVIAESETIMNTISEILDTANDINANHNKLYELTNMYADTAIIDLTNSNLGKAPDAAVGKVVKSETSTIGGVEVNKKFTTYTVKDIDFALIERPRTEVVIDKEIKSIKLTSNDGKVIFDAIYDISYEFVEGTTIPANKVVIGKTKTVDNKEGFIVANISLNQNSIGTDVLQAINKVESNNDGIQNFRFVNVDPIILQGATIEINYVITALNIGEVDYTSKELAELKADDAGTIKSKILGFASNKAGIEAASSVNPEIGKYLGSNYYTGNTNNELETVVSTRVRQLIDYVDNDAVFTQELNTGDDHSWRTTTSTELKGNGRKSQVLISSTVLPEYDLTDPNGMLYTSMNKNNIVLSSDDIEGANSKFERKLVPFSIGNDDYKSQIDLVVTRVIASQDDTANMSYDNIAEIVKIENSVGRRDVKAVTGNANPKGVLLSPTVYENDGSIKIDGDGKKMKAKVLEGEFASAVFERDASATELITFTPPTGQNEQVVLTTEILVMVAISLAVIVVGILIIKKKALK